MSFCEGNAYDELKFSENEEIISLLYSDDKYYVERITSSGQQSDFYIQDELEFVVLMQGQAKLWLEGRGEKMLRAGDFILIDRGLKHKVTHTSENCVWLCFFIR